MFRSSRNMATLTKRLSINVKYNFESTLKILIAFFFMTAVALNFYRINIANHVQNVENGETGRNMRVHLLELKSKGTEKSDKIPEDHKQEKKVKSQTQKGLQPELQRSTENKKIYTLVKNPSEDHFRDHKKTQDILIYQYTEFYHNVTKESFKQCEYSHCDWTTDAKNFNISDAVLFHMWGGEVRKKLIPRYHPKWQKWIFYTKEAPTRYKYNTWSPTLGPVHHLDLKSLNAVFNVTMTYMTDSDVTFPYGRYLRHEKNVTDKNHAAGKTGQVAWVVSHCNTSSAREALVKELQKYVQVDIYGKCGPFDCPKEGNCFTYLGKKYKFYLGLENSDCEDYISEKLWFNAYSYNMVPIVRGTRANYEKLAPPGSFIHWDNYSVKQLADLIKKIDKNDDLYNKYFEWRKTYSISTLYDWHCDMCKYLHQNKRTVKYYTNLEKYWNATERCVL